MVLAHLKKAPQRGKVKSYIGLHAVVEGLIDQTMATRAAVLISSRDASLCQVLQLEFLTNLLARIESQL
jgi:hypothetical protein